MFLNLLLQIDTATTGTSIASKSILEIILSSGTVGVVIIGIQLILTIISIYIFIERWLTIGAVIKEDERVMQNLRSNISSGNIAAIQGICASSDTPLARMVEKGLSRLGRPMPEIESAIENVGRVETFRLEKKINYLSLIARLAPMFGFLGTILGVIKIFFDISQTADVSIGVVSAGLYVKMVSSAAGLVVGVLAYIFYNWLNIKVGKIVNRMERNAVDFLDFLKDNKR